MEPEPASDHGPPASAPRRRDIGYLTPLHLSTGGVLKADPEDFVVEEVPAYLPSGAGEHLYLWVEKRDVGADLFLDRLARAFGISRGDIGMAGLKDRRAITRQWISVPARCEPAVAGLDIPGVRVLSQARHANKLKTGHLRGNRFEIRLRDANESEPGAACAIAAELLRDGVPNLYGDQRFGSDDQTLELGFALLRGDRSPRSIPYSRRKFLLRLALSSVQSALFNEVLAERLAAGTIHAVLPGDVMQVAASGGCFLAEDIQTEQARCNAGEIVVTGPMFGPRMKSPQGPAAELEAAVLSRWGLDNAAFEKFAELTSGTRRPLLAPAEGLAAAMHESELRLEFGLPAGSYATSVVREFQKLDRSFPPPP